MYQKNKTVRLNVRISPEQAALIDRLCDAWNTSQSGVVRSIIESFMWSGQAYENKQANLDDKL